MKKNQLRQIEMFNTVLNYLEQHRSIWDEIKSVSNFVKGLQTRTRSLMDKMRRQSAPTYGATQQAQDVRSELELSVLQLTTHLTEFAAATGNRNLAAQCQLAPSILDALSRDALVWTAERVHASITEHMPSLADFGITQEDATALQSLLEKFNAVKNASRRAIAHRVSETTTLPKAVGDLSKSYRQLDRLMTRFGHSHPEFIAGYRSARRVLMRAPSIPKAEATPAAAGAPKEEPKTEVAA